MLKKIVNIKEDSLQFTESQYNDKFKSKSVSLSKMLSAQKLGYRLVTVEPGFRAWPYHSHRVNEEMFFILEGQGIVRIGEDVFPIQQGDVIAALPGGHEVAHQIINNSDEPITYMCVSTMEQPDVTEYPDSGKFGVFVGTAPGGSNKERTFTFFGRESGGIEYWEDE
jgi:uncharacterized cupin superfamily protein